MTENMNDDIEWMKRFSRGKLTEDDILQANAWAKIAGKHNINIENDWLASGELVGSKSTGKVNGLSFYDYLVKRHREFVKDWKVNQ